MTPARHGEAYRNEGALHTAMRRGRRRTAGARGETFTYKNWLSSSIQIHI